MVDGEISRQANEITKNWTGCNQKYQGLDIKKKKTKERSMEKHVLIKHMIMTITVKWEFAPEIREWGSRSQYINVTTFI